MRFTRNTRTYSRKAPRRLVTRCIVPVAMFLAIILGADALARRSDRVAEVMTKAGQPLDFVRAALRGSQTQYTPGFRFSAFYAVRTGDTAQSVRQRLGVPGARVVEPDNVLYRYEDGKGHSYWLDVLHRGVEAIVDPYGISGLVPREAEPYTKEAVKARLGSPDEVRSLKQLLWNSYVPRGAGRWVSRTRLSRDGEEWVYRSERGEVSVQFLDDLGVTRVNDPAGISGLATVPEHYYTVKELTDTLGQPVSMTRPRGAVESWCYAGPEEGGDSWYVLVEIDCASQLVIAKWCVWCAINRSPSLNHGVSRRASWTSDASSGSPISGLRRG